MLRKNLAKFITVELKLVRLVDYRQLQLLLWRDGLIVVLDEFVDKVQLFLGFGSVIKECRIDGVLEHLFISVKLSLVTLSLQGRQLTD